MKSLRALILFLLAAATALAQGPGSKFVPATVTATPYTGDFGPLPTGARDFTVEQPRPAKTLVVNAADFGIGESTPDLATQLNKVIAHCKQVGASKLVLSQGRYKITENIPITFEGLKDFEFDAGGSTFVYLKETGNNMRIADCERVAFRNFNFDWDWKVDPLASLVEVVAVQPQGKDAYVEFKFLEYDDFPNKQTRMVNTSAYDLLTQSVGWEGGFSNYFCPQSGPKIKQCIEWVSGNVMRIYNDGVRYADGLNLGKYKPKQVFRMQHYYYHMHGVEMSDNRHLTLENINVYSCAGHAFVVKGKQQYWQMIHVNIKRPAGVAKRAITCTADHLHIARSRGFFKMLDCEFSLGADDCINMHDNTGFARRETAYSVKTKNARVVADYQVGELVELRQGDFSPSGFKAKIKEIRKIDPAQGIYEIFFSEKVPEQKMDGFILFNWDYDTHNIVVRNCSFHGNRARGILILARDVTIEYNRFYHHEGGAIKIETGYTFDRWSEGYGANNIVIRNNTFEKSCVNYPGRDILMDVYMKTDPSKTGTMYPILSNILIENNTFKDSSGFVARIGSTGNLTIRNNTFINDTPRRDQTPNRGCFWVEYSTHTRIVNNTYIGSPNVPAPGVYFDPKTTPGIEIQGNKINSRGF